MREKKEVDLNRTFLLLPRRREWIFHGKNLTSSFLRATEMQKRVFFFFLFFLSGDSAISQWEIFSSLFSANFYSFPSTSVGGEGKKEFRFVSAAFFSLSPFNGGWIPFLTWLLRGQKVKSTGLEWVVFLPPLVAGEKKCAKHEGTILFLTQERKEE